MFDVLPVELKVEIFSHCLPQFPTFNPDEAPVALTRVCYSWNVLALNTPRLWSSFAIYIEGTGAPAAARDIQLMDNVKRWLHRSNPYPLNIRLTHITDSLNNESHRSGQILALLINHAYRWKHVELTIPSGNAYVLQRVGLHHLPALKSLSLRTNGSFGSTGFLQFSLTHVPWRQITAVNLQLEQTLINFDHCLQMLRQTKRLQECSLNVDCTMSQCDAPLDPVLLPSLTALRLTFRRGSVHAMTNLFHFLNAVQTPKLLVLHLGWSVPTKQSPLLNFSDACSFFERLSSTLRQLTIAYLPLSAQDLQTVLYQLPNITHLTLKYPLNNPTQDPITDAFFSAGTPTIPSSGAPTDRNGLLLPRMKHCSLECHGQAYTSAALVAFIRSRTTICQNSDVGPSSTLHSTSMIESFRMLSLKVVLDAVQSLNRKWMDDGMNISIEALTVR